MLSYIPNLLSIYRIITAPCLLLAAWKSYPQLFLFLFAFSLSTDFFDGFLARRWKVTSELGSKLDSMGDIANYLTVPFCAWWLWPELIVQEAEFIALLMSAYLIPLISGVIKFKRIPSYHTWAAKAGAVTVSLSVFLLFIWNFSWPFRFAVIYQTFVALEEIVITIHLEKNQSNVKSLWHIKSARKDYIDE